MKIEKILTVTYRTLLTKTTNFSESDGLKNVFNLRLVPIPHNINFESMFQQEWYLSQHSRPFGYAYQDV